MYGDYGTTCHDLLHKAKLPTLELGREKSIAIMTYKIIRDQASSLDDNLSDLSSTSMIEVLQRSDKL